MFVVFVATLLVLLLKVVQGLLVCPSHGVMESVGEEQHKLQKPRTKCNMATEPATLMSVFEKGSPVYASTLDMSPHRMSYLPAVMVTKALERSRSKG